MRSGYHSYYPLHQSWKRSRTTQYRSGKRGQKHSVNINDRWYASWKFTHYCKVHNIPCEVIHHSHQESRWEYRRTWAFLRNEPYEQKYKKAGKWCSKLACRSIYGWIYHYDELKIKRTWSVYDYTELIWWSNKDIGIEYILVEK